MDDSDRPLQDRCILITGASGGLGRALSIACSAAGATVILSGRKVPELEITYDLAESAGHAQPAIIPLDLMTATEQDYEALAEQIKTTFGGLHGLVHCAASLGALTPLAHYPTSTWTEVFNTNLHAPLVMTQQLLPVLTDSAPASVLFTVEERLSAYWGAYGLSKAALISTVAMLADECEGSRDPAGNIKVRVNGVLPGPMRTRLRQRAFPGELPDANPRPETRTAPFVELLSAGDARNGNIVAA